MTLTFMKTYGAASDYIVANAVQAIVTDVPATARRLCRRRVGVGADGLIVFRHQGQARFTLRCFDPGGNESLADDDVLRCCARAIEVQYGYRSVTLAAGGYIYESRAAYDDIGIRFPVPRNIIGPFDVQQRTVYGIWAGADNIVAFLSNLTEIDLATEKTLMRHYSPLSIDTANVTFAQIRDAGSLRVRTYHREGDAETLSSGAGALAAAVLARQTGLCHSDPIEVETHSDCSLTVHSAADSSQGLWLYGPAVFSFEGVAPEP